MFRDCKHRLGCHLLTKKANKFVSFFLFMVRPPRLELGINVPKLSASLAGRECFPSGFTILYRLLKCLKAPIYRQFSDFTLSKSIIQHFAEKI